MDRLSDYDYVLPESLIAQTPLEDRSASRLLHLDKRSGAVAHRRFADVIDLLEPADVLVLNDTRVSALRLKGRKQTGGAVEALLLHPLNATTFEALLKPGRRLTTGSRIKFDDGLEATVLAGDEDGVRTIQFDPVSDFATRLARNGTVPLPPYIHEPLADSERYQTVYASHIGSAAAPTAGLHFTEDILERLTAKGVAIAKVTLHVSLDTFRPVQVEDLAEHVMHGERCIISPETAEAVNRRTGRLIAVGTTSVRTLETFATTNRQIEFGERDSKLFIRPGYEWKVVDAMFTNFHLPRTTMLAMISALAGRDAIFQAYREAIELQYRFLSFGDSMFIA